MVAWQAMRPVVYQLFVRHFSNFSQGRVPWGTRDENGCGSFSSIDDAALEAIARMGVTHLWLTGVLRHATQTSYPGLPAAPACVVKGRAGSPYAVTDYFDVDPDLATRVECRLEEFRDLLARCRRWGMVPMMDFIPNHVSRCYASVVYPDRSFGRQDQRHVFFARDNTFYYLQTSDPAQALILPEGEFEPERGCARVTGNNAATWTPGVYDWYETVKLNYGSDYRHGAHSAGALPGVLAPVSAVPRTWQIMNEVLQYWQDMGVGGFRCDMAHMVPMPFWRWAIANARLRDGGVFFMAEAYNDHMKLTTGDVHEALLEVGFNGVYDSVSYQALRSLYEGGAWANDLDKLNQTNRPLSLRGVRYVENHAEPRMAAPSSWGGVGESVCRAAMVAQYASTCSPVLIYNGQEVGERAEGPGGFGGDNGRTSIFDYTHLPRLQHWTNGGRYDGALLTPSERDLRTFVTRLLPCLQHPALARGGFYGLNWANRENSRFGRESGETVSGHRLFAFLRHDRKSRTTVLVVCNLSPHSFPEQENICVHIPAHAVAWSGKKSGSCEFRSLLQPDEPAIPCHTDILEHDGLPLHIPAGQALLLEWI